MDFFGFLRISLDLFGPMVSTDEWMQLIWNAGKFSREWMINVEIWKHMEVHGICPPADIWNIVVGIGGRWLLYPQRQNPKSARNWKAPIFKLRKRLKHRFPQEQWLSNIVQTHFFGGPCQYALGLQVTPLPHHRAHNLKQPCHVPGHHKEGIVRIGESFLAGICWHAKLPTLQWTNTHTHYTRYDGNLRTKFQYRKCVF